MVLYLDRHYTLGAFDVLGIQFVLQHRLHSFVYLKPVFLWVLHRHWALAGSIEFLFENVGSVA